MSLLTLMELGFLRYRRMGELVAFFTPGKAMNEDLDREEVVAAIDRLVADLLDRAGIDEPPVDAIALAQKQLGMDIRPGRAVAP